MFHLSNKDISGQVLKKQIANPESGACVIFEGWVRNHNEGKPVSSLEYEGYPELCVSEAETIFKEAQKRFSIEKIICSHRVGHLEIGGMAVWLGVTARHRGSAFEACRYIIDQIKFRLPIWKKEFYEDGEVQWVNCQECAKHGHAHSHSMVDFQEKKTFNAYYKRQMVLPQMGVSGQEKLSESRVLVVGAGGLGCAALQYLVGAGIGHISICDDDTVDISNLHRQPLYGFDDLNLSKAELAAEQLRRLNPMVHIKVWNERITANNVQNIMQGCDLVLDCTDNFTTKYLLNDAAWLMKIPYVFAGLYQWEGQLMVVHPSQGDSGCLRCLWPKIPDQETMGTCAQVGILGGIAGTLGAMQSVEAIKLLMGNKPSSNLVIHDFLNNDRLNLERIKDPDCPLCGSSPTITEIVGSAYETNISRYPWEYDQSRIATSKKKFLLTDISEFFELENSLPPHVLHMPYSRIINEEGSLGTDQNYLFICSKGIKSKMLTFALREKGIKNVYSFIGGWNQYR